MDIQTVPITALPRERVQAFYRQVYPQRRAAFVDRFEWRYRVGGGSPITPVMAILPDGRIAGQAAGIPVQLRVAGTVRAATWFIDFIVSPDLQRQGIGQVLTRAWMDRCDTQLGQPNDRSIGVLEKYGWRQQVGCYRFALPINLATVLRYRGMDPRVATAAGLAQPIYRALLRARARRRRPLEVRPLSHVGDLTAIVADPGPFGLVRDRGWLHWRFVDSPVASEYVHAADGDAHLILRVFADGGLRRAHVLYASEHASQDAIHNLLARLVLWALEHEIDLLWAVCSHPALVRQFGRLFPAKLPVRVSYHATGETGRSLEQHVLSLHAMDSDADIVYGG